MADLILFITSIISASISYVAAIIFTILFAKEQKTNRLIYGLAFLLYGLGHTIQAVIAMIIVQDPAAYTMWMWIYVNLGGAGTTGLVLYSTFPFVTDKKYIRELVTSTFILLYVIGSAFFAFILPSENPLTIFLIMKTGSQLGNMSWWVVECLIPVSFYIGFVFVRHYKMSGSVWGLFIGLSFIIYAIILFIWPIPNLKPIFYIFRTISVSLLCAGGIILAKE
ncbi:MAG: hypothetical protein ACTSR8_18970 [Promethearchaeota archaeon]